MSAHLAQKGVASDQIVLRYHGERVCDESVLEGMDEEEREEIEPCTPRTVDERYRYQDGRYQLQAD